MEPIILSYRSLIAESAFQNEQRTRKWNSSVRICEWGEFCQILIFSYLLLKEGEREGGVCMHVARVTHLDMRGRNICFTNNKRTEINSFSLITHLTF